MAVWIEFVGIGSPDFGVVVHGGGIYEQCGAGHDDGVGDGLESNWLNRSPRYPND